MAGNVVPCSLVTTFLGNFLVPYSGLKDVLKMEAAGCPETLAARSYAPTQESISICIFEIALMDVVTGFVFKAVTFHLLTPEARRCISNGIRVEHRIGLATMMMIMMMMKASVAMTEVHPWKYIRIVILYCPEQRSQLTCLSIVRTRFLYAVSFCHLLRNHSVVKGNDRAII